MSEAIHSNNHKTRSSEKNYSRDFGSQAAKTVRQTEKKIEQKSETDKEQPVYWRFDWEREGTPLVL